MSMVFTSPQTKQEYTVVNTGDIFVCYRKIDHDKYRVRIQSKTSHEEALKPIKDSLAFKHWGPVKDDDHISIITDGCYLGDAIGDAIRVILNHQIHLV